MDYNELYEICKCVREEIIELSDGEKKIHYGGSLSCVEAIVILYYKILNFNADTYKNTDRDKFILSKGHACLTLYIVLSYLGYFDKSELKSFKNIDSILQGHPDMNTTPGIDMSTGSLGQGLSVAVGMALGEKLKKRNNYIYCLLGDGECQSGQVWEAAMAAAHFNLDNIILFIDNNKIQVDGYTEKIMNINPIDKKWEAFGWYVKVIDGHNINKIIEGVNNLKEIKYVPKVVILNTIKGKGIDFMENNNLYHSAILTKSDIFKKEGLL